jgi:hypothetical protein
MGQLTGTQRFAIGLVLMCGSALMAVWSGRTAFDTGNPLLLVFCGAFCLMIVVILKFITSKEVR